MLRRILLKSDKRCLYRFIYNFGIKGILSFRRFQKRLKRGVFFPAFHFISVTDDCNLNCQGCWATGKISKSRMKPETLDKIISEARNQGSFFFGILGGEPLMYKPLFEVLKRYPDCYFQLFTNGTLLSADVAEDLRRLSNVTPLISFEGDRENADIRRGGTDIYEKTRTAVINATGAGLITGVAVSICKSNIDFATSESFINSLIRQGVIYLWYYIYRPAGENPVPELCLSKEEINKLRLFIVKARREYDILIIDAYWDEEGRGLCPAASGLSHHINAAGYIEPCPVIQFATDNAGNGDLEAIYSGSDFLKGLRTEIPQKTTGCIFMEDPKWLVNYVNMHGATDTSGRGNETERLNQMPEIPSHGSADLIPEKSFLYRFAKKRAFFGLGAYG